MKRLVSRICLSASLLLSGIATGLALWAQQQPSNDSSPAEIEQHVEAFLRQYYAWGEEFQLKVDPPAPSPMPGLLQATVEVTFKRQRDTAIVYVSRDGRFIIRGSLDSLFVDPFASNRALLRLDGHPFTGPEKACVNVVEFSDFECPHCRELNQVLSQVEPRYPQVRFTFMDFPIVQIHPWAMTAALIARCAYQENPASYGNLRQALFDNQDQVPPSSPSEATSKLLDLASQSGFNTASLRTCIASPNTRKLVDADLSLAKQLSVNSTPTVFVNGRPLIGGNGQILDQFITYELTRCSPAPQPQHNSSWR